MTHKLSVVALGAALVAAIFLGGMSLSGCHQRWPGAGDAKSGAGDAPLTGRAKAIAMLDRNAGYIGWIGLGLVLASAISFILSFKLAFISTHECFHGVLAALGCLLLQYIIYAYGQWLAEFAFWLSAVAGVGGGAAFAYPYVRAWMRRRVGNVGNTGDLPAGAGDAPPNP